MNRIQAAYAHAAFFLSPLTRSKVVKYMCLIAALLVPTVSADDDVVVYYPTDEAVRSMGSEFFNHTVSMKALADSYDPVGIGRNWSRNDWSRMRQLLNLCVATRGHDDKLVAVLLLMAKHMESDNGPHPFAGWMSRRRTLHWDESRTHNWRTITPEDIVSVDKVLMAYVGQKSGL